MAHLLHVEALLSEVVGLTLVLLFLLEHPHGLLLDGVLARTLPHLAHLILVFSQFCIEPGNLLINGFCAGVNLKK